MLMEDKTVPDVVVTGSLFGRQFIAGTDRILINYGQRIDVAQ